MSPDNDTTIVLALNQIEPLSAFPLEMLDATYTLGACLLLCEVSEKSVSYKKGINFA